MKRKQSPIKPRWYKNEGTYEAHFNGSWGFVEPDGRNWYRAYSSGQKAHGFNRGMNGLFYLASHCQMWYCEFVAVATKTLKLPFLRLNQAKATEFAQLQKLNTELANRIVAIPKSERKGLTTASFRDVEIGSAWVNQTIRNANAETKVKQFKVLPLEVNNQNWTLHKVGQTFSISFGIRRGIKKRIPLEVHSAIHSRWLEAVLSGQSKQGSLKLFRSRKGIWYALISVSMDVPDAKQVRGFIGVDRGQNIPAVAALPNNGRLFFFKANRIKHARREFAKRREKLQAAGKHRAVKKLDKRESRIVAHINHKISKEIVGLAKRFDCGIRFEDLTGIRKAPQKKKVKKDAGQNKDYWPFYQLETFTLYKALGESLPTGKITAAYTSQTHHKCGHIGKRSGLHFYCPHCDEQEHADGNAARNISMGWDGRICAWEPSKGSVVIADSAPAHGVYDSPLNLVSEGNS